jgi:hypothetical protein
MRSLLRVVILLVLFPVNTTPQAGSHAKPAGIPGGDTLANQQVEPPMTPGPRQINIDQVNSEIEELRRLANGLPTQIDQVTKGQLPKDPSENLKRIEKLAKQLRSQIVP